MGAARMPGAPANGMILAPWGSFASTAGGIHTTHAERRAARQSSSARTANATTPQVYPLLRRSSSARSPPRPRNELDLDVVAAMASMASLASHVALAPSL